MCIISMVDDGGLADILTTAEQVATNLSLLSSSCCGDGGHSSSAAGAKRKPSRSLSEVSNNTERSIMDLSRLTSTELDPIVSPLIHQLEKINAAELLSLKPTTDGEGATLDPSKQLTVTPIHDYVSPRYEDQTTNNIVRYLHVSELPNKYSAGIFVFPPNTNIPLHDHPGMIVISRVLYGELNVQSYDVLPVDDIDSYDDSSGHSKRTRYDKATTSTASVSLPSNSRQPSVLRASINKIKDFISRTFSHYDTEDDEDPSIIRVKPNLNPRGVVRRQSSSVDDDEDAGSCQMMISAPNVTCLYPHKGNCHSFRAGPNGAAVLDILLPPYDSDDDRDCTFYETNIEDEKYGISHDIDGVEQQVKSYTLTSISQPEDFHCLGGSYGRFGTCKDCE